MTHRFDIRVYYEDTDLAGIVYYANYLKFIERARTEWVRGIGVDQARLRAEAGIVFAVRRVEADYLAPARFDDVLSVETDVRSVSGARIVLGQDVLRGDARLFSSVVTLVALTDGGRPARLPADVRRSLT
ncbi:MAG: tol-pal system-associated acyl-CoA thioesterase [Silicimonas sp.]|nr:tol-pal system-associated acyl-CoA thioesterase [Silicimonas sp.]RZW09918.1 MAG: tol-pal system-associated acyl-CoA thioesterase [Paracoccaceae bacterium]